uniref:BTB domain-containing protein n=1 Tax=Globodera pallida TaxID=36090 RepID=A0A183C4B8_GLOPA
MNEAATMELPLAATVIVGDGQLPLYNWTTVDGGQGTADINGTDGVANRLHGTDDGGEGVSARPAAATMSNSTKQTTAGTNVVGGGSKSWIKLNVGGKMFLTTRQTLCRESGSFLARLSQEDHSLPSEKDESSSYLIDRDSDYFSAVLNYLRHGKMVLDHGLSEEGLREEAEFYNLPKLISLCNERIAEREKNKKTGTKHVYRVLQCHEDELTNVISAMSDGWKFEQLVPIGHSLHASESGQPEYLCVVSREYPVAAGAAQLNELSSDRAQFLQKKAMNG